MGTSDDRSRALVIGYVEDRMSRCLLDERLWMPDDPPPSPGPNDPPVPLDEPGRRPE